MSNDYKIKVLWIDDEPNDDFLNEAYDYGLDLDNALCLDEGMRLLSNPANMYDAIILDGNCRLTNDKSEQPSLKTLTEAFARINKTGLEVPTFVYTAANYEGKESLEWMIPNRDYDNRDYYRKPAQRKELYSSIKMAVNQMKSYVVKKKYHTELQVCPSNEFLQLLIGFEENAIDQDPRVPNTVRKILERLMSALNDMGVLPVKFNGSNLNECSRCLDMMRGFVPAYIARCMHKCAELTNEGSHSSSDTDTLLRTGQAPYLNKSLVLDLLNIVHWRGLIQGDVKELRKKSIASYTKSKKVKSVGKVVKNADGVLMLGNKLALSIDRSLQENDMVAVTDKDKCVKLAYIG